MFILRGLKRLILLCLLGGLLFLAAHYPVNDVPLYKKAKTFFTSQGFQQGWKDLKLFLGGLLRSVGEEMQEDVSESDRKALEKEIQNHLKGESE